MMRAIRYLLVAGLVVMSGAARAQSLPEAQSFVTELYSAYQRQPGPDYLGKQIAQVFAPDLVALIKREAASVPKGDVGALDGDPICDCQDWQISKVEVTVSAPTPGAASAEVRFQNAGEPRQVRLDLVPVQGHWRVGDVHTPDMPSLAKMLQDRIAQNTKAGRP